MKQFIVDDNQYNIGYICTRRQCEVGKAEKVAMRWISPSLERTNYTFNDLEIQSNKFANLLTCLGFSRGDVFFTFLPKMPEQFFAFLGALKAEIITGTLFSNFGEEALQDRLGDARAKGIITKKSFLKKLVRIRGQLPFLKFIIVVDVDEHQSDDILSYSLLMDEAAEAFDIALTSPNTPSVVHYTSGSTGKPKGVLHVHKSVLHQNRTTREILNLSEDDVFWCTADQGWVTGTSYGIIGPWSFGVTQVHFGGNYDAKAWFDILEEEEITVWYSAPTALRMLMREDHSLFSNYGLAKLQRIFSVGEPLNPEVISWARKVLQRNIYDTWFQTETGAIMITNCPDLEIKPGSMGKPVYGVEAVILDEKGKMIPDNAQGNLCLKEGWSSMFITYLNNDQAYRTKFNNGYYYTGDAAYRDKDGYFWFVGRTDDVINTAGHLVSPFEIESALLEIEEIAESGVVGVPDELLFEKVVAFIHLHQQYSCTRELELKIRLYVANKVSSIATPQELVFVESIPKNKSGKIMRRVLKAIYLGTDAGDTSTLEI